MQTRLIRYIQDRSRVLAAVSHDLKTPLTHCGYAPNCWKSARCGTNWRPIWDEMEAMVQATLDYMRGTESKEPLALVDIDALLDSLQEDAHAAGGAVSIQGKAQAP